MDESATLALAERALGVTGSTEIARGGQKVVYRALLQGVPVILKITYIGTGRWRAVGCRTRSVATVAARPGAATPGRGVLDG